MDNKAPESTTPTVKAKRRGRPPKLREYWSVIDGGFAGSKRPEPPPELTDAQAEVWRHIVASEPPDFFASYTTQEMLKDLCCHRAAIDAMNQEFNNFKSEWMKSDEGMKKYKIFLKVRGDETRHFSLIATRLRLTNQSRYTPQHAATVSRNAAKVRPWEQPD